MADNFTFILVAVMSLEVTLVALDHISAKTNTGVSLTTELQVMRECLRANRMSRALPGRSL